ncbi:LpqB family beta-propeller domain-containing protein [Nonomuraea sp. NPDC046802]|uniref:LpqB family beta-propeller domain-containing protein n=1 Tax=Nonomuraea sp. NPDC046802 TaxID=3154919 RepID=UPI0033C57273
MTTTRRGWAALVLVALVGLAGSGCTVIPLSGPNTLIEPGTGDPLTKPFQRMIALPPQPTWGPEEVIKGLQAAMAAYADDPSILPQYLTPEARSKWSPSGPVTVIEDAYDFVYPSERDGTQTVQKITVKGRWAASIKEDDAYVPTGGAWDRPFELVKVADGGYRVSSLPTGLGLLLTNSDVARAYRATNLYYVSGNTPDRLVVDRVRLRLTPTKSFAQTILERLLQQPTSALQGGAVTSSFPQGTKVEYVVWREERVVVNLSRPLDPLDPGAKAAVRAQIRYSLNMNEVAKGRTIDIQVDGEPYSLDHPDTDDHWLEDGDADPYFVSRGAIQYLGKDGPAGTVPGPAGQERTGYRDFALSKDNNALIAARTSTGISVAGLTQAGQWQEVIQGDLTAPSWHRDGSLWTFDRKNGAALRYDPAGGRGPERVEAEVKLQGLDVTRLRIARDGVRVVLSIGENTVQICALAGNGAGAKLVNFQSLATTGEGERIIDLAWADDEHLLMLVESDAGQILNQINVGDGETVGVPLKDRLQSLAGSGDRVLAWSRTGSGAETKSKIVELNQDRQTWTPKVESDASTPLFPLG